MAALSVGSAIVDGESVMVGTDGVTDFFALHAALSAWRAPDAFLSAFDLIELDGEHLRSRPLVERWAMLAEIMVGAAPGLTLSDHLAGDGEAMLRHACAMGLEGIVAKRVDAPYRSGRRETWLKVKCTEAASFAVTGFDPHGRTGVRSLQVAALRDGKLSPAGWVGSGLSEAASRELRRILDAAGMLWSMSRSGPGRRGRATMRAQSAGELHHPVFKGWHEGRIRVSGLRRN